MTPLAGLQVLDLTSGPAGGLATMILSDFGATVKRLSDPEFNYLNDMPSAQMWLRGKTQCTDFEEEIKTADILIISTPNGFTGVDYGSCKHVNSGLIYCEITSFENDRSQPLDEAIVAAKAGRMKSMEGIIREPGPNYAAVPVATHSTAHNIVSGVLAGVYKRLKKGHGQKINTSLLLGLIPYDQGMSLAMQVREDRPKPDPFSIMPTLNYHPVQCADGKWLQLGNLLPHLFQGFMKAIGLEASLANLPDNREEFGVAGQ